MRKASLLERLVPWVAPSGSSIVAGAADQLDRRAADRPAGHDRLAEDRGGRRARAGSATRCASTSNGVTIALVDDMRAGGEGLQPSDVIVAVDGKPVRTVLELRAVLAKHRPGDAVAPRLSAAASVDAR